MSYRTFGTAAELNRYTLETREKNTNLRVERELREIIRMCNIQASQEKLSIILPNKYHQKTIYRLQNLGFYVEKVRIGDIRVCWG